jgi:hypothetical protein
MTNTSILCFVIGWQGGTIHQLVDALKVSHNDILNATDEEMGILCRKAQRYQWENK